MLPLAKKQAALDRAAIQGWRGLLAERDPDRWEQFERERRQRLARGIMWPPARADVALIAAELEMEDEQRELIQGLLEDYSVRRDAHVRSHLRLLTESFRNRWKRREKRLELSQESQVIFDHEVANGTDPLEAHERAAQVLAKFKVEEYRRNWREQEPTRQLRTLNLQYAHMVASLLEERSEELAALFRDAVRREMYPAAYRPQPAAKYVEIVLRLDLDDDVRRNAEEVMESYHFRDDRLGEAVVRAQDKVFLDRYHSPNGYLQSEMANQEREREAIDARAQLSDEIVEILFRMLTPAQQAAAPKPSPSPRVTSPQ